MTKEELVSVISQTLDAVEQGCENLQLDEKKQNDINQACEYFRETMNHEEATKDYLLMIAWAFNVGAVYGVVTQPNIIQPNIIVVVGDDDMMDLVEEKKDEQVH